MSERTPPVIVALAILGVVGMVFVVGAAGVGFHYYEQRRAALAKLRVAQDEINESSRKALKEGHGIEGASKRMEQARSNLNEAALSMGGNDRKILVAGQQVLAVIQQKVAAFEKAFGDLKAAGMVRSTTLPTRDSIQEREKMVKRLDDANTDLEEVLKSAESTLRAELRKQGLSEQTSANAAAGFAHGAHVQLILRIRACDREINAEFQKILDLLDTRWGTWKAGANDRVLFDDTPDADVYNSLRQQIAEISQRERAAQAELLETAQRATGNATPKP